MFERSNKPIVEKDLQKKMVLLAGPRQVGKTTLAKSINPAQQQYFNFDFMKDRKTIVRMEWEKEKPLIILDEIHKMKAWKRWLKGVWDTNENKHSFLVTGSARLDYVRKSGESMAGRYYLHRLHPLSVLELSPLMTPEKAMAKLLLTGGFPEPFFAKDPTEADRWRRGHVDRILREDMVELEHVTQVKNVEFLIELLAERVGSTISYSSLAEDLSVAPKTVKRWIEILESLYVVFTVPPYSKKLARALRKESKVYFYDIGKVPDGPARLENLIACHLLKRNHDLEDHLGKKTALHFVRDKEKREVDFLTLMNGQIDLLVEVKTSDDTLSPSLRYYSEKLAPKHAIQVVQNLYKNKTVKACDITLASEWLSKLTVK